MTNVRPVADRRATCTFSSAVSVAKVAVIWNVRLTPRRQIAYGGRPEIRSPRNATRPASAASWPVRMLKNVVFPAPFGPMSARISPRGNSKETPSPARRPPSVWRPPPTPSTTPAPAPLRHDTEEPARTREPQRDQNPAEDELPVLRVPGDEGVERRVHGGAERGAAERLDAAEEHHHQRLDRHRHAEIVGEDAALEEREHRAGEAAEEPGDDERHPLMSSHVHTDGFGAPGVVAGSAQRETEGRTTDPCEERDPASDQGGGAVGSEAERRRVAERHHPAGAHEEMKTRSEERERQDLHQHPDVEGRKQPRRRDEPDQQRGHRRPRQRDRRLGDD